MCELQLVRYHYMTTLNNFLCFFLLLNMIFIMTYCTFLYSPIKLVKLQINQVILLTDDSKQRRK